jgi:hypothetical protein
MIGKGKTEQERTEETEKMAPACQEGSVGLMLTGALQRHLTEWKWLMMKDVTGCCRFVADLLPIKCLIINDVTDVADF